MKKDICQTCVHLERDGESGWNCDCYGYGITKMGRAVKMEAITSVERKYKNGHMYVRRNGADWTEVEYQSPEWFNSPPMTREEGFEWFKRYAVEADTLEEFNDKFHNWKCGYFDIKGYRESAIEGNREWLEKFGYAMIPSCSSETGKICTWYGTGSAENYQYKKCVT